MENHLTDCYIFYSVTYLITPLAHVMFLLRKIVVKNIIKSYYFLKY